MNKKLYLSLLSLTMVYNGIGQVQSTLDHNNVDALVNTNGILFNDANSGTTGYEIPKNSGNHALFSSAFWFGGSDVNGGLKICAQKYANDDDLSTGPLSTFGGGDNNGIPYGDAEIIASQIAAYDRIWTVSQAEIQSHIQNYNISGYVMPDDILEWPAHGDTTLGQAFYLAPFIDSNNDGVYVPQDGDYPNIRGDKASYMILNDKGNIHSSGGNPIGLELHFMIYQYTSDDFLDNTTFVNMRMINRGTQTIFDFKIGNYTDPSIGDPGDDHVGCKPSQNLMYAYNADNDDSDYGLNPPAFGVLSLNNSIETSGYTSSLNQFSAQPQTAAEYWGYLNGQWGSSTIQFTEGGNGLGGMITTNFIYPDTPTDPNGWSEVTEGNNGGDKQMFFVHSEDMFSPGEQVCYDFAYVYSRAGDHLQNVDSLFVTADSVQNFYDNQIYNDYCAYTPVLSVDESEFESILNIYPNPARSTVTVEVNGNFDLELFNVSGQSILSRANLNSGIVINTDLPQGLYIVKVTQNKRTYTSKLIIEK